MGRALPALMIALGILLLIATLYDVALRMGPWLIPFQPSVSFREVTVSEVVTSVVTRSVPINLSTLKLWYPHPFNAIVIDLSKALPGSPVEAVTHINDSTGILKGVTLKVIARINLEPWNSTVMVHLRITFFPPLPNGTEVDVMPSVVAGEETPLSLYVSQRNPPLLGEVREVNVTLCYLQEGLPTLSVLAVRVMDTNDLTASDSFLTILKVGYAQVKATRYWKALMYVQANLTPPPSVLPLSDGGALVADALGGDACGAVVVKLSPEGTLLNATTIDVVGRCPAAGVELRHLASKYLLAVGDFTTRRLTLILLSKDLSVVRAVSVTLPEMFSWSVATLGSNAYVSLTGLNTPYVTLLVFDDNLSLLDAWAYSVGFPPNNLTPAETWCRLSAVSRDLMMTCMPAPPPANLIYPKSPWTPAIVIRLGRYGEPLGFKALIFRGVGMVVPLITKLGNTYLFITYVNILNSTQVEKSSLVVTLSPNLTLMQAKLVNITPLSPDLLVLGEDQAVLVGSVDHTPYLLVLNSDGEVVNASPLTPERLFRLSVENRIVYVATQEAKAVSTELTVTKLPISKANATVVAPKVMPAQVTQPSKGSYVRAEPLPQSSMPVRISDVTHYVGTHPTHPQVTVTPIDP